MSQSTWWTYHVWQSCLVADLSCQLSLLLCSVAQTKGVTFQNFCAGEAAATSQQLKSAVAATKVSTEHSREPLCAAYLVPWPTSSHAQLQDAVQSLKSSIKIELAGMISGTWQGLALPIPSKSPKISKPPTAAAMPKDT